MRPQKKGGKRSPQHLSFLAKKGKRGFFASDKKKGGRRPLVRPGEGQKEKRGVHTRSFFKDRGEKKRRVNSSVSGPGGKKETVFSKIQRQGPKKRGAHHHLRFPLFHQGKGKKGGE